MYWTFKWWTEKQLVVQDCIKCPCTFRRSVCVRSFSVLFIHLRRYLHDTQYNLSRYHHLIWMILLLLCLCIILSCRNYVIQFILGLNIEWATTRIVDELAGNFGNLSLQKCGSHVVEQCLKLAPRVICDRIINELMNDPKLLHIILDQFGNYVIQTALKQCQVNILLHPQPKEFHEQSIKGCLML